MPTGYTSPIYEGEDISGEDFILSCARQFGGLIHMRDEPSDAPIRLRDMDTKYYDNKIKEAKCKIEELKRMSAEDIEREIEESHQFMVARYYEQLEEKS